MISLCGKCAVPATKIGISRLWWWQQGKQVAQSAQLLLPMGEDLDDVSCLRRHPVTGCLWLTDRSGRLCSVHPGESNVVVSRECNILPSDLPAQKSFDFDAAGNVVAVHLTYGDFGDRLFLCGPIGAELTYPPPTRLTRFPELHCQQQGCMRPAGFASSPLDADSKPTHCARHATVETPYTERFRCLDVRVHPSGVIVLLDKVSGTLCVYGTMQKDAS